MSPGAGASHGRSTTPSGTSASPAGDAGSGAASGSRDRTVSGADPAAASSVRNRSGSAPATSSGSNPTRQSTTTPYAPPACSYRVRKRSYFVLPSPYSCPSDQNAWCRSEAAGGGSGTTLSPAWNSGVSPGARSGRTASTTWSNDTVRRSNASITAVRTRPSRSRNVGSPPRSTRTATMSMK